jgi:nucleoside-diphosphate-sugar epimerase
VEVLVSGATGFVGTAIMRHLLGAGHTVRALTRSVPRGVGYVESRPDLQEWSAEGRLTLVEGDVTAPATLAAAVAGVHAVVQAAQFPGAPVEDPARGLTYENVDHQGTVNLLHAVASSQATPHFLYMSGITVEAGAKGPWNLAKWKAEEAIRTSGLAWTIVRSCWAYGPGDKALNRLLGYSDHLPFIPVFGNGRQKLTPVFVEDIGALFAALVSAPERARDTVFRLGGPDDVTLSAFLRLALKSRGRRRPVVGIPVRLGRLQAHWLQHLPGRPLTPDAVSFVAQEGAVSETDRLLLRDRFPGFAATPLREALATYLSS